MRGGVRAWSISTYSRPTKLAAILSTTTKLIYFVVDNIIEDLMNTVEAEAKAVYLSGCAGSNPVPRIKNKKFTINENKSKNENDL